ncbi:MAG: hypothetical protein ACRDYC_13880 [Acidimicrobiales bacterium]
MNKDDRFRRWQAAGSELVESAKERAESLLRGAGLGGEHNDQNGHSDGLIETIRHEITRQLSLLGVATKDDLAGLEKRLKEHSHDTSTPRTTTRSRSTQAAPATGASAEAPNATTPSKTTTTATPRRRIAKAEAPKPADQ